ncbi:odorant receptor 4-like [Microplitis demolitor]|uniref:odorant receptor 4-like n=1 Tax=Microplitis demolitor TaxID=69319 RepID=UPI00235B6B08|nr:odorant receptor 4-like [Microplitis demolitor]
MDIFEEPFYKIIIKISHLIGQWPTQPAREKFIITTLRWIIFLMQIIPMTIAIVIHLHERDVVFESVSSFAICLAFAVKYMNVVCSADMIKELWETIRRDWKSLLNDKEKRSLQFESNLGHFFSTGYAVFAYVSATIFVTEPIFPKILSIFVKTNETVPLKLALPLEYLFIDLEHHYWILYIVSTICIYNTIFIIISCDILFITFVQHVCGLFAVIGCRLENMPLKTEYPEGYERGNYLSSSNDISYKHMVSCIRGHKKALEYVCAKYIEDAYTWSNGILAILNAPVISITSFLLITEATTIDQTLKYATFTLCQVSHLFYLCFMAQKLEDMSLRINENIKNAPWYNNSIKAQKLLLLMSMRSQVPCKLTACKIMDLSIANFAAVIKTSASYITMLLQTQ